tara:strand:+ start:96 stop:530 length:435 start_codon:yes stop_codon:yes gene_type:complete
MKYFAELNSSGEVLRVLVFKDNITNSEIESTPHEENGTSWIEAFKDGTRGNFPGVGYTYDVSRNVFVGPKHFNSWVWSNSVLDWESPQGAEPSNSVLEDGTPEYSQWWDEENLRWLRYRIADAKPRQNYVWEPDNNEWVNLQGL